MSNVISITDGEPVAPDFITRIDINTMNDQELEEFIERIRMRRMASFIIYQQTQADMEEVREEKAKLKLVAKVAQIERMFPVIDKQLEKLETQINMMRGLRIQAGMSVL